MAVPNSKAARITTLALSIVLGLAFLASGIMKLMDPAAAAAGLAHLGVSVAMAATAGVLEVAGAALVLIPKTRFYGALLLGGTMLGAVITHLAAADFAGIVPAAVLGLVAAAVAWLAMPVWAESRLKGVPA